MIVPWQRKVIRNMLARPMQVQAEYQAWMSILMAQCSTSLMMRCPLPLWVVATIMAGVLLVQVQYAILKCHWDEAQIDRAVNMANGMPTLIKTMSQLSLPQGLLSL